MLQLTLWYSPRIFTNLDKLVYLSLFLNGKYELPSVRQKFYTLRGFCTIFIMPLKNAVHSVAVQKEDGGHRVVDAHWLFDQEHVDLCSIPNKKSNT